MIGDDGIDWESWERVYGDPTWRDLYLGLEKSVYIDDEIYEKDEALHYLDNLIETISEAMIEMEKMKG